MNTAVSFNGTRHIVTPDGTMTECGRRVNTEWPPGRHATHLCMRCENEIAPCTRLRVDRIKRQKRKESR